MTLLEELKARGFYQQLSDEGIGEYLEQNQTAVYVGFDPTADSLHLGHLVPILMMSYFQQRGHKVIILVGGATGMIGDPSGKSAERNLLTAEDVEANKAAVKKQMSRFVDFSGDNAAVMVDNFDWIGKMSFVDWLRDVGKYFTINYMVAKESVKQRMASESGISYTEFSYMTMQAYDFLHLHDTAGCTLQCGGNDQWGNITAGIDLVRKTRGEKVFGMTFPLMTSTSGEKFGKTAGNAVWLDANRTSPYQFYQYWLGSEDADIEKYMKIFTELSLDEISAIVAAHMEAPEKREGQKRLAAEITRRTHGDEGLKAAQNASEALFGGELDGLGVSELLDIFSDVPSTKMSIAEFEENSAATDLFAQTPLANSRGQARRLITQGGAYINNKRIEDPQATVAADQLLGGEVLVLRSGKKKYHLIQVTK